MASESLFEEQSDAAKVSEMPYPANGSGKNPAADTRKYIQYFQPLPGFFTLSRTFLYCLLSLTAFFLRSRMTGRY